MRFTRKISKFSKSRNSRKTIEMVSLSAEVGMNLRIFGVRVLTKYT